MKDPLQTIKVKGRWLDMLATASKVDQSHSLLLPGGRQGRQGSERLHARFSSHLRLLLPSEATGLQQQRRQELPLELVRAFQERFPVFSLAAVDPAAPHRTACALCRLCVALLFFSCSFVLGSRLPVVFAHACAWMLKFSSIHC